jgi:exopolysaccharide biosynthesis polyprenyl glycosylphosphotransferase
MLTNQRIRAIRALNTRGIRLLHIADVVVIYVTLMLITAAMSLFPPRNPWSDVDDRYWWSYGVVALMNLAVFYFGGLYDREPRLRSRVSLPKIVALVWVASLLAGVISLMMLDEFLIPRSILIIFAVIAPLGIAANRVISQRLRIHAYGPPRVLLVGTDNEVDLALTHLRQDDDVDIAGSTGGVEELEKYVEVTGATDVLLLDSTYLEELYTGSLERLEAKGVGALQVVGAHDSLLGLRNVGEIGGIPFVGLSAHVLPRSQERLKRFMDLSILTLALPIALPVLLFMTAYVGVVVRRPLLFVQDRVGKNGTTFPMLKYRSMPTNSETDGPVQAEIHDPRVIRGMHWVRQMRLDELPQLWNVARGQMSIVGPRPERPEEMAAWERKVPGYRRRHQVPPGITGLAQVYGYALTDPVYKLGHDLHYLANWSPILDLQIIARSAWVIVSRRG